MNTPDEAPPLPQRSRAQVAGDVLLFQVKLFLDGLRDVLLFPASILVGIIAVVFSRRPGEPFYRLLRAGKATEQWLDLFGEAYVSAADEPQGQRKVENWRELEQHLRELDASLREGDIKGTTLEGAARIRRTIKNYFDSARKNT